MPSHSHTESSRTVIQTSGTTGGRYAITTSSAGYAVAVSNINGIDDWIYAETNVKGSSQSHNNLQPYITVYMYKRVS